MERLLGKPGENGKPRENQGIGTIRKQTGTPRSGPTVKPTVDARGGIWPCDEVEFRVTVDTLTH